ncbi:MAG: PAS domain S-box protein [Deltaproteobacteria bacterium]|nr:PAS domain S-box protein [Deltaproteobacteria bacterium]
MPIFIFITIDNLDKQKEYTTALLVEKGAALIRSFEAGARTGIGMQWSGFQLQKLLIETAQQADIDYFIVTDARGRIHADSDPSMVGETYGADLDLEQIAQMKTVQWRRIINEEGADTFEVYRRFAPVDSPFDAFQSRIIPKSKQDGPKSPAAYIIYVGLNMETVEKARTADFKHALVMGAVLLLIGFAGIVMLLLAQGYQTAKSALSQIKAFSDSLVEHMPIGLVALNRNGEIISINRTAENVLKLSASGVINQKAEQALPPLFLDLTHEIDASGLVIEKIYPCPLGDSIVPLEIVAASLNEEDGSFMGHVILFRDITEMRRLENELSKTRRLASIGSIAAGIAHEIRNPLSSIKGFATYFRDRYRDVPEDKNTADILIQEADRLNRVISQLLTFARPMTIEKTQQPIQKIIRHCLKMIEGRLHEKGIGVVAGIPDDIAPLSIDRDAVEQALLNIFINAVDSMDKGGVLSVSLFQHSDAMIRIEVSDTGCGIAEQNMDRLLDLYFTTKPSGTGLGLPIVQKIIDAHDGEIKIFSQPGLGTTVTLLFPTEG